MVSTTSITLIGVIPSAFLWLTALARYDGKFDDRKVFYSFIVGLVGGAIFGIFHRALDAWALTTVWTAIVVFVLLFAFAQIMYLVVVVNRKGLRQKHDAIFAGMSFGFGSSGIMVVYLIFQYAVDAGGQILFTDYLVYFALAASYALVFGAAGIFAGLFAFTQNRDYILSGAAVFSLYSLVTIPFRTGTFSSFGVWVLSLVGGVAVALVMFLFAYKQIEPNLPVEMEKELRRESRKRSRVD